MMKKIKSISLPLLLFVCICMNGQLNFKVSPKGYLAGKGISVLTFNNSYYVGKQGGIEIIQNDKRLMTNGGVKYRVFESKSGSGDSQYFSEPIPQTDEINPNFHPDKNIISTHFRHENGIEYKIEVIGKEDKFQIVVDVIDLPDANAIEEMAFNLELFPGIYRGKSFAFEKETGFFPIKFNSEVFQKEQGLVPKPMGKGHQLVVAPEDPEAKMVINAQGGEMFLLDTRSNTDHNWYTLKTVIHLKKEANSKLTLTFYPAVDNDYEKKPVIAYSQIGYHNLQKKVAVIEVDTNYQNHSEMVLYKYDQVKKEFLEHMKELPEYWGVYNRYDIYTFDFSRIKEDGLYYMSLKGPDVKTNPFRIAADVYQKGVWQPTIETFLPVQMCHMRIKDRNRIWHGACHLDDAFQAPAPMKFLDGFTQGDMTDTQYDAYETIPYLNRGGWHDAGDDDVNTNSTGRTVYHLALINEEFGVEFDQTTIDFKKQEVFLHKPDGESDIMQNMVHGLEFIIGQYNAVGHGIAGMVSSDYETYFIPGTWGHMTDQLFYDPSLDEDERTATHSGKRDDRFAFTNKDSRAEFRNAWVLAAAGRNLKGYNDTLSEVCIELSEKIWEYEMNNKPVFHSTVGVPRHLKEEQILASVELYLTTAEAKYLNFVEKNMDYVIEHMESSAWAVSRIANLIDKDAKKVFEQNLKPYSDSLRNAFAKNPYGTYLDATLWGYGWDILWRTYKHYFLVKNYPEFFTIDPVVNCNEFLLGRHPYSNVSYVSGVGNHIPIPAFGMNRSDYSYIPGGVFSGVNMIEPDFPELMEDHPFIWQQSEYIIHGATPYVFTVLAVDRYFNKTIE